MKFPFKSVNLVLAFTLFILGAAACEGGKAWTHCNGVGCPDTAMASADGGATSTDTAQASQAVAETQQQTAAETAPPAACTKKCSGKVCGSDSCGGNCGTCSSTTACSGAGQCESLIDCGGICATGGVLCAQDSAGGLKIQCRDWTAGKCFANVNKCAYKSSVFDTCDDNNAGTTDSLKASTDWLPKSQLCIHTPISGGGGQTGGSSQAGSSTTSNPTKWAVRTGPDVVYIIVWVFAGNKFGSTELWYKEYAFGAPASSEFNFELPGGAGLVCYTAKYQPTGGGALWSPGQVGQSNQSDADKAKFATNTVIQRTITDGPLGYTTPSWTGSPSTPPCVDDMGTKTGCLIGKVYSSGAKQTDNWICHIP